MSRAPESVYLKLARAKEHLKALNGELVAFGKGNPYTIQPEINEDRRQVTIKLKVLREPPVEWGLILGDCAHNFRCVIDHLAFALPRAAGTDPRWERSSQFPICDTPNNFNSVAGNYLLGVDGKTVAAVEGLQPYYGGNRPEGHGLWYLRNLSNLDKHRLSPLVWYEASHGSVELPKPPTGTARADFASGSLVDGATVVKIYFSDPAPKGMNVTLNLTFGITIRDIEPPGDPLAGVNFVLERICDRVENAVVALEPFIP